MRRSGILMHITSLPGPGGIGALGAEAYAFADFLQASGTKLWQVLPVGPTGYGESPYSATSVVAGNVLLISCPKLREEGLLSYEEGELYTPADETRVDFDAVRANKEMLLRRCFAQSRKALAAEVAAFVQKNSWVKDFALFTAVKSHFGNAMWSKWPDEGIRLRKKAAVAKYEALLAEDVAYHTFCQYLFRRQWFALKKYCNDKGIQLLGDMPIYVAEDSADTWCNPKVFQMDKNRVPKRVAGVPPDCFTADGQLWGNPLYNWCYLRLTGFDWWVKRMAGMAELYDIVRVDHFIGFANYYSIPYGAPNARSGKWVNAPGFALFRAIKGKLPHLQVVAEDLGNITDRVKKLLQQAGFPGMKILVFGVTGGKDNSNHVSNWSQNCVVYTGTHDNDTVLGWLSTASSEEREGAMTLAGFTKDEDAPKAMIAYCMESVADYAIVPMQDVLGLDGTARMNVPGTIGGNWVWRMAPGVLTEDITRWLKDLNERTHR